MMPGMFNTGNEPPKKTQQELEEEEEKKRIQEEEKRKHNLVFRLKDSNSKLETEDLEEDELKTLNEVSRKGYYHARQQQEDTPGPRRIDEAEAAAFQQVTMRGPKKGNTIRKLARPTQTKEESQQNAEENRVAREDSKADPKAGKEEHKGNTPLIPKESPVPSSRKGGASFLQCCKRR
mmetsp:Transcript_84792/g.133953  ORF Transcript_84792/g.133953 Transcript_84792/m.133953 type:complete len:178 (+) Transcript_84792:76-609(+)